jgi:DNA-binding beta-propeller fold protein YncE
MDHLNSMSRLALKFYRLPRQRKFAFILVLCSIGCVITRAGQQPSPSWALPKAGWLYVFDFNQSSRDGKILLVDPTSGRTRGTLSIGGDPEVQLSPDGKRLYVASIVDNGDYLSTIDTATGVTIKSVPVQHRWRYTLSPDAPTMAVSHDGHWIYLYKAVTLSPGQDEFDIAVYDTIKGAFLPREAEIRDCVSGVMVPLPEGSGSSLSVFCEGVGDVRFLTRVNDGLEDMGIRLQVNRSGGKAQIVGTAALLRDGNLKVIENAGHVVKIDPEVKDVIREFQIRSLNDSWVPVRPPALSPDGTKLYFVVGSLRERSTGRGDEIAVLDVQNGKLIGRVKVQKPVWTLALGLDGRFLYALDPFSQTISVTDTTNYRPARVIGQLGAGPVLAFVAPQLQ